MEKEPVGASHREEAEPRGWGRTFAALSDPKFRLLWIGSLLSFSAQQMTIVARPWLAYELSGSALVLGIVAAAQGIPMLVLSPFGGVAADRLPKRVVLLVTQGILVVATVVMTVLVFLDLIQVWHLVLLAIVMGSTNPFNQPVRQSYVPLLLNRRLMPNGVALHSSARNLDQVLAPSIAGVLLAIDPGLCFAVVVVLHFGSMLASLRLPLGRPEVKQGRGVLGELSFGVRYVATTPVLRTLVGLALLAVLLGFPFQQLLPVFQDVLNITEIQFGIMYSMVGAGSLAGSLTVASFSRMSAQGYPQLIAGICFGVTLAAFALSPVYLVSLAFLFLLGFASQTYMTMNQTLMMLHSDPGVYGRVASVSMMIRSFQPMSVLPMGALADVFGAPRTLAVSGGLLVLAVLALGTVMPSLWRERGR